MTVPVITNSEAILQGQELILKVTPPPKKDKEPTIETWKAGAKRSGGGGGNGGPKKQKASTKTTDDADGRELTLRI